MKLNTYEGHITALDGDRNYQEYTVVRPDTASQRDTAWSICMFTYYIVHYM